MQLNDTVFLDPDALVFVRFEDQDPQGPMAILKFKAGASETLTGEAARDLRSHLVDEPTPPVAEAAPNEEPISGAAAPAAAGARILRLGNVVITADALGRGQKKAWFLRCDEEERPYILAFVNAKGSCSVRTFDAQTGVFLGKHYHAGDYQDAFAHLLEGARKLTVSMQPNLERDCRERLPDDVLEQLRRQIRELTSDEGEQ
jgi:hypothetical protein